MTLHDLRELAELIGFPTQTHMLVAVHDEVCDNTDAHAIDYLRHMIYLIDRGDFS